jgi:hypothetical protein
MFGLDIDEQARPDHDENWSTVEEEVSQILKNLRGLTRHTQHAPERCNLPNCNEDAPRYAIELDVLPQYASPNPFFQQKTVEQRKLIDTIKEEQRKPVFNHPS